MSGGVPEPGDRSSALAHAAERRAESAALHARVQAFIAGTRAESFDALACALARYQAKYVAPVARTYAARGLDPAHLVRAADIPALPTEAFKLRRIAAQPASEDERVFRTSGTTAPDRGSHPFRSTATYTAGALAWARRMVWPDRGALRLVALVAPEAQAPESSLAFMVARFAEALGGTGSSAASFHWDGARLDVEGVARACHEAHAAREPALVVGTAFAFVAIADAFPAGGCALPSGSRAIQTGGFKGRSRTLERDELYAAIASRFALPESHVIGEYGMTELSSQLYEGALAAALGAPVAAAMGYFAPPWLSVTAVDPVSLAALPEGERGLARFVDLANVDSSVAVETADLVSVRAGAVELFGRMPGAEPRGCSLALEALLDARDPADPAAR